MLLYLILVIGIFFGVAMATEFSPCKSTLAPTLVEITGCDKPPCILKKGTNLTWVIEFTANGDHDEIVTSMKAVYMGVTRGYPGLDGKVSCDGLHSLPDKIKVGCPVQKGKKYRHETLMQHRVGTPKITLPVKYGLRDKTTKEDIVCSEIVVSLEP